MSYYNFKSILIVKGLYLVPTFKNYLSDSKDTLAYKQFIKNI